MSDEVRLICENGHLNTFIFKYSKGRKTPVCKICGAETYGECPNCGKRIKIPKKSKEIEYFYLIKCEECGKDFPWTEQAEDRAKALMQRCLPTKKDLQKEKQREIQKSLKEIEKIRAEQPKEKKAYFENSANNERNRRTIKLKNQPDESKVNKVPKTTVTKQRQKPKQKRIVSIAIIILFVVAIAFAYNKTHPTAEIDHSQTVYVSRTGIIHKDSNCCGMIHYEAMPDSTAHKKGYRECKVCYY